MANNASTTENKTDKPAKAARGWQACNCLTGTGKTCPGQTQGKFARGHDARIASRLAQAVAEDKITLDQAVEDLRKAGGGDLLEGKMRRSAQLRIDKASAPAKDKAEKPAKVKGEKAVKTAATDVPAGAKLDSKVKVHHGNRTYDAVVVRNASDQLVARHRLIGKNCDHDLPQE